MKMALDDQTTILRALYACHDGVVRFIPAYPNVVETSSNLAIIDIEDGKAAVQILARSAREDMKDYIVKMLMTCFHLADFKVETGGDYIGWLIVSLVAFSFMCYVLITTLIWGDPVQGYPTLMTVVLFLGGVQLLSLGIIGEYLGRIFHETKNRPVYLVRESAGV